MPLIIVGIGIVLLLVLIVKFKVNAFFSLLIACFVVGVLNGLDLMSTLNSVLLGIGNTLGKIILILVFGAMLGKIIETSGAAHVITKKMINLVGVKNVQYAILVTGFIVGIPMMYNASFLVMIPLIYALSTAARLPLMYLGIPLAATLSIAHGYLPPSPAPIYVSYIFGADINLVLLYGLVPVIPACLVAGIVLSKFFTHLDNKPPAELYKEVKIDEDKLPSLKASIGVAVMPVVLMLFGAIIDLAYAPVPNGTSSISDFYYQMLINSGYPGSLAGIMASAFAVLKFFSDANIALMTSVCIGIAFLGLRNGNKMEDVMKSMGSAVGAIGMIIMIIAAGGAFSQVLKDSNVNNYIGSIASGIHFNPLILTFCVAAVLRLAVGSATVATMTAAPIMLPIAVQSGIAPELMVLATGSGSLMFSHFNDIGFWMFKEYFNVSIKNTFLIWTVMECIVAIIGLLAALFLNMIL